MNDDKSTQLKIDRMHQRGTPRFKCIWKTRKIKIALNVHLKKLIYSKGLPASASIKAQLGVQSGNLRQNNNRNKKHS